MSEHTKTNYHLKKLKNITITVAEYAPHYLDDCDIVIAAVNDIPLSKIIR